MFISNSLIQPKNSFWKFLLFKWGREKLLAACHCNVISWQENTLCYITTIWWWKKTFFLLSSCNSPFPFLMQPFCMRRMCLLLSSITGVVSLYLIMANIKKKLQLQRYNYFCYEKVNEHTDGMQLLWRVNPGSFEEGIPYFFFLMDEHTAQIIYDQVRPGSLWEQQGWEDVWEAVVCISLFTSSSPFQEWQQ